MARLESVRLTPHRIVVVDGAVIREPTGTSVAGFPQVFWETGRPWREANLWFYERYQNRNVQLRTVIASAAALHAYAQWLERTLIDWWDFPPRKADRCLVRYRGALIKAIEGGELAASTASARMRIVVAFYRWLLAKGLLSPMWPMWRERSIGIRLVDPVGFQRTIGVHTTDLAIPNRLRRKGNLEGGVTPISADMRDALLALARNHASQELHLMLTLGFFTGMRLGSICDLKIQTLLNAVPDAVAPGIMRLAIGPGANPRVATKFGVTGQVIIPAELLDNLRVYAYSVRRLHREALATPENRKLLFLTRFGRPYAERDSNKSASLNVEMLRLRRVGVEKGLQVNDFSFHQSRATFATAVAEIAIKMGGAINAVALVRELLLHKDEATSLRYIKFVEKTPIKAELANEFTRLFLGLRVLQRETLGD